MLPAATLSQEKAGPCARAGPPAASSADATMMFRVIPIFPTPLLLLPRLSHAQWQPEDNHLALESHIRTKRPGQNRVLDKNRTGVSPLGFRLALHLIRRLAGLVIGKAGCRGKEHIGRAV